MSEKISQIFDTINWDIQTMSSLDRFLMAVDQDQFLTETISVLIHVLPGKNSTELRLAYNDSRSMLDGIPQVVIISRFQHSDQVSELLADSLRIRGKRNAVVVKDHD